MHSTLFIVATSALWTCASAYINITLCSDWGCKDQPLAEIQLNETGCRTDFAGQAVTLRVMPDDLENYKQSRQRVRFYRSTDCFAHCGSGHLIAQLHNGGQLLNDGMRNAPVMQSFELVNVDENGKYPPHGYCGLRHGDAQFFRGRTWKWQQVGIDRSRGPVFQEVPLEEWDDALHPRLTSSDYMKHGTVDSTGKTKWRQTSKTSWSGMPLESWDEQRDTRNEDPNFLEAQDVLLLS